jgi:hypothetical protein
MQTFRARIWRRFEDLAGSFSICAKSPMHSSSVAGREIFVSHNSRRVTAYPEVIPKRCGSVRMDDNTAR